ncbi:MAG: UvrD-helicase domain-containing protein [Solirubrobacteraceae bacterium]
MSAEAGGREGLGDSSAQLKLGLAYEQESPQAGEQERSRAAASEPEGSSRQDRERSLTDEQERAVARREGSLLLAAGAGSGKTSVLVERFVRAVREDGIAPGRILAITFTERAAGELRARVRSRLLELDDREVARQAQDAFVSTFHGFCARLLRTHPLQAGVEPGFRILEEGLADRLRALAFADALAGFLEGERPGAVDLVAAYGADPLRAIVLGAYVQLRSQGQAEPRLPAARAPSKEGKEAEGEREENGQRDRAEKGEGEYQAGEGEKQAGEGEKQAGGVEQSEDEHWEGEKKDGDKGDEHDAIRACDLIGELIVRFGDAYTERKHARASLDFDDLELVARDLLEQRADVRQLWAERFQMLMVDEFQDSNRRQLQVLAALDRDNLFTVGDELQSIYGFRHAEVSLFRERHAELRDRGASLALTRNFRSRPAILAAVERIFAARIGERFAPLRATRAGEDAKERDDGGAEHGARGGAGEEELRGEGSASDAVPEPIVELLLTDRRGWDAFPGDDALEGMPEATPWRQAEARLLAARVAQFVASGQVRPGEIVVLLRALGDLPVYESALRQCGLRTLAGVGGFWSHQQVGDLLAWLRTLANPLDELALYSTLASPLVGLSSDGLALLAGVARERHCGIWQVIEDSGSPPEGDGGGSRSGEDSGSSLEGDGGGSRSADAGSGSGDASSGSGDDSRPQLDDIFSPADRERIVSFRSLFAAERASAPLHSISELLRRAIAATGYDAHVLSLGWGERRLANVHKLIRLARRFEAEEGRDLRGFLDHVAHIEAALGREADAPVGDGEVDAVRLMSIHSSKGLEFPVVCVADLGREPNLRVPDLLVDADAGRMGLRLLRLDDPEPVASLSYDELRAERRHAQEQEEDRVLYVALTRAQDRLVLSGSVAFERWPALRPGVAPIAWLAPALVPDACALAASEAPPTGPLTVALGNGLSVRCLFNAPAHSSPDAPAQRDEQTEIEVTRAHRGTPARRLPPPSPMPLADPDATVSYTSLSELERCGYRYYLERVLRMPESRAAAHPHGDTGVEARTRGTIVHLLLESLDFARPLPPSEQDVAAVARRIGASVSPGEREEIAALIAAALASEPAARLARARRGRTEHPFAFSLSAEQPLVTGVLDLIVEEPDGLSLIVDYKSDRLLGGEDLEQLVRRDYAIQRLIYALAAIEDGAHEVEVSHWFLERPASWVSSRFASHERSHLREQLLARLATAQAKGFAVTQAPHRGICLTCPGRGGLCSWGETRTMSERSSTLEFDR